MIYHSLFIKQTGASLLFLLFCHISFSQSKLDYGIVLADSNFHTSESDAPYSLIDSGVHKIENSTNEFEIRLCTGGFHLPFDMIILAYNKTWTLNKYFWHRYGGNFDVVTKTSFFIPDYPIDVMVADTMFSRTFRALKANHCFDMPYHVDFDVKRVIHDGIQYDVTFKADNQFRNYSFSIPGFYKEDNPNVKEFDEIINIVRLLESFFN